MLLKYLLELSRAKSINIWLQYQKNVYVDQSDDIVNKYNNTYHRIIKLKSTEVKKSTYFDFDVTSNEKDPKFKVDAYVRISECKSIFTKGCTPNW